MSMDFTKESSGTRNTTSCSIVRRRRVIPIAVFAVCVLLGYAAFGILTIRPWNASENGTEVEGLFVASSNGVVGQCHVSHLISVLSVGNGQEESVSEPEAAGDRPRYLLVRNRGGFGNQIWALVKAVHLAMKHDRTLIMPPIYSSHIGTGSYLTHTWAFPDFWKPRYIADKRTIGELCPPSSQNVFRVRDGAKYIVWEDAVKEIGLDQSAVTCDVNCVDMGSAEVDAYMTKHDKDELVCIKETHYLSGAADFSVLQWDRHGPLHACPLGQLAVQEGQESKPKTCAFHWRTGDFKGFCEESPDACYFSPREFGDVVYDRIQKDGCDGGVYIMTIATCNERGEMLNQLSERLNQALKEDPDKIIIRKPKIQFQASQKPEDYCPWHDASGNLDVEHVCIVPYWHERTAIGVVDTTDTITMGPGTMINNPRSTCSNDEAVEAYASLLFDTIL
eukprot:Clim_evm62s77 gene=Clim_evmTU62s77